MNQYVIIWLENTLASSSQPALLPKEYGDQLKLGSRINIPDIYYALGILVAICDTQEDAPLNAAQLKKLFAEYAIKLLPKEDVLEGFTLGEAFVVDATDFARDELGFEAALKCGIGGYQIFPSNTCGMNLVFDWINLGKDRSLSLLNEKLLNRFCDTARNMFQHMHINEFQCDNKAIICDIYILCYDDLFHLSHFMQNVLPQVILTNDQRESIKTRVLEKISKMT